MVPVVSLSGNWVLRWMECSRFTFSDPCVMEKVLCWSQIFDMEIFMKLRLLKSHEFENNIFSNWSMCTCVYYQHHSKINYNRNSKFDILLLFHMKNLFKTSYEDRTYSLRTGAHKRIFIHYILYREFLVSSFLYI